MRARFHAKLSANVCSSERTLVIEWVPFSFSQPKVYPLDDLLLKSPAFFVMQKGRRQCYNPSFHLAPSGILENLAEVQPRSSPRILLFLLKEFPLHIPHAFASNDVLLDG